MRMSKTQLNTYIDNQKLAKDVAVNAIVTGGGNTAEVVRNALKAASAVEATTQKELKRQELQTNPATAIMYQLGGDAPEGQYTLTLLEEGEVGGITLPNPEGGADIQTGYQLLPVTTGASIPGVYKYSEPFDGVQEIGPSLVENTLKIIHNGMIMVSGWLLPEPNANNRQTEVDLVVYDSLGAAKSILSFKGTENLSGPDRGSTSEVPTFVVQNDSVLSPGDSIGLCVRKAAAEASTTITVKRSVLNITFLSIDPA